MHITYYIFFILFFEIVPLIEAFFIIAELCFNYYNLNCFNIFVELLLDDISYYSRHESMH